MWSRRCRGDTQHPSAARPARHTARGACARRWSAGGAGAAISDNARCAGARGARCSAGDSDRTSLEGRSRSAGTSGCVHCEKPGQFVGNSARWRRAARSHAHRRFAVSPRWRARRAREIRSGAVGHEHFAPGSGPRPDREKGRVAPGFVTGQGCHFSEIRRFAAIFSDLGWQQTRTPSRA